jgi:hypothetical protein
MRTINQPEEDLRDPAAALIRRLVEKSAPSGKQPGRQLPIRGLQFARV